MGQGREHKNSLDLGRSSTNQTRPGAWGVPATPEGTQSLLLSPRLSAEDPGVSGVQAELSSAPPTPMVITHLLSQ